MKMCFLTVLYNTSKEDREKLEKEVFHLGIHDFYSVDNTNTNKGFAEGINSLIQQLTEQVDIFFIANPDISLSTLHKSTFLDASSHFDIWGYAMQQNGTVYYGGTIDPWRMSGGLSIQKPKERFIPVDFVSGSLMAVKREVIERIGYLNTTFGMYYEDVEFCFRAVKAGFHVGVDTQEIYTHFETSQKNAQKKRYLARNRMRFLWQYGTWQQKLYELARLPKTLLEDGASLL